MSGPDVPESLARDVPWTVRLAGSGPAERGRFEVLDVHGHRKALIDDQATAHRIARAVTAEAIEAERAALLGPRPSGSLVEINVPASHLAGGVVGDMLGTVPLIERPGDPDVPVVEYAGDRFVADGATLLEYGKPLALATSPERAFLLASWLERADRAATIAARLAGPPPKLTDAQDMRPVIRPEPVHAGPRTGPVVLGAAKDAHQGFQVLWRISPETEIRVAWEGPGGPLAVSVATMGGDQRRGMTRATATPEQVGMFGARLRAFADFEEWDGRAPRCSAHGDALCWACSQIGSGDDGSGGCLGCEVYGLYGMHWDTCPHRLVDASGGPVTVSLPAAERMERRTGTNPTPES